MHNFQLQFLPTVGGKSNGMRFIMKWGIFEMILSIFLLNLIKILKNISTFILIFKIFLRETGISQTQAAKMCTKEVTPAYVAHKLPSLWFEKDPLFARN